MRKQNRIIVGHGGGNKSLLAQEKGSYLKKWTGRQPVALLYPNSYSVGMSSLGFQLVYNLLGSQDHLVCERFFLPDSNQQLRSVESQRPLHHFPLIFLSISFEHDYLHFVQMLELAGITPFSSDRPDEISEENPLIVCGGVAAAINPEPLAPFVDCFIIGEAEPILLPFVEKVVKDYQQTDRHKLLSSLAREFSGCYVPSLYTPHYDENGIFSRFQVEEGFPLRVKKLYMETCSTASHSQLVTPEAEFSEMHLTELGRGCSRGCRFCAAGFIYRPPRLWDGEAIVRGIQEKFEGTDRVGLLGMEMAELESLEQVSAYLQESGCALSFSSLRADRLSESLLALLGSSKLKSVAIAPDGSSERLRKVINKGLSEVDLLDGAGKLVEGGIFKLKLYLMIGLPTENDEDLQEAVDLITKIKERIDPIGKVRGRLTEIFVSVNCFAPKPWTPFQYHPYGMSEALAPGERGDAKKVVAELKRRQKFLRTSLSGTPNVHIQFDKPENVLFQAVLARGDRRLGPPLEEMARTGIGWKRALKNHNLTPEQFAIYGFSEESIFPWYIIDHGISTDYLWNEYQRAFGEKLTKACDTRICRRCGVCHD